MISVMDRETGVPLRFYLKDEYGRPISLVDRTATL